MSVLDPSIRNELERAIIRARDLAEAAADKALQVLAVEAKEPRSSMSAEERRLRVQLRAVQRRLASYRDLTGTCAYEHWHRMLFARFLSENGLLLHPELKVAVTLDECAELGRDEGESDKWVIAARYAAQMLPGIFPQDDPVLQVRLAAEDRQSLERIAEELPSAVFTSDDGLGWTYQFWQSKRKKEVNASGMPVSGADLAAVTQLFTEHYMVQFLLQNTLGAWWLSLHPDSALRGNWPYHKAEVQHDFSSWPDTAADLRMIDPCCGSGHFLVEAFNMLLHMHQEEGRTVAEAVDIILANNLHGLEIDARCVQIAAFALALSAWKAGYPTDAELPIPNIACSGLPLGASETEWHALANGDDDLADALVALHKLFANASEIGSLLDLSQSKQALPFVDPDAVLEHLSKALRRERNMADPVAGVFGSFVNGGLRALDLLGAKYHLAVTNPPFLIRGRQGALLKRLCGAWHPLAKKDLGTCFVQRCRAFVMFGGVYALVTPQNWLFLATDRKLRQHLLTQECWLAVVRIGEHGFASSAAAGAFVALSAFANRRPRQTRHFVGLDASVPESPGQKAALVRSADLVAIEQLAQLDNPDHRIVLRVLGEGTTLGSAARCYEGLHTGDYQRFGRKFWELPGIGDGWVRQQGGPATQGPYAGREHILFWESGNGDLIDYVGQRLAGSSLSMWIKGHDAWGRCGVAVSAMRSLKATLYTGELFTHGVYAIIPEEERDLPALWQFCQSPEFGDAVRALDQKLCVARGSVEAVRLDLQRWRTTAAEAGCVPQTYSEDPTQWVFQGRVKDTDASLHVSTARMLGYRWPDQSGDDEVTGLADPDGIVCLPSVLGEAPAVERLRYVVRTAYGDDWTLATEQELLEQADSRGKTLEEWLRDHFFRQHAKLFHNRPFIWHIWDGQRDGFAALVNYHSLDKAKLEKLIYSYLGDWIRRQKDEVQAEKPGAEIRLRAAEELKAKLEAILVGEKPYDICVRWKLLEEQPVGWEPDLNDGVRLNIRPFVLAGILRSNFTISWKKDRGRNPDGSERINDIHLSLAEKRAAREAAK